MLSSFRWSTVLVTVLAGVAVASVSCGDDSESSPSATGETSATRVDVTQKEFTITAAPASAKAGEVRFFVKNTGKEVHELVVVKSDAEPGELPTYGPTDTPAEGHVVGDVNEDELTSEGEVEDIDAGATKDATFVLEPGNYLLICNLPTHYAEGMRAAFTVK